MESNESSIGTAQMLPDGTLVLDLRAEEPGGSAGHGRITYTKDHPAYRDVLAHLGGMQPGEKKLVPPWPDE